MIVRRKPECLVISLLKYGRKKPKNKQISKKLIWARSRLKCKRFRNTVGQ